ncbi:MAG: hypothetical protein KTR31_02635 [Myxococcales bacterium]|nr:hypothetical protein [Myxococcales bacterium]
MNIRLWIGWIALVGCGGTTPTEGTEPREPIEPTQVIDGSEPTACPVDLAEWTVLAQPREPREVEVQPDGPGTLGAWRAQYDFEWWKMPSGVTYSRWRVAELVLDADGGVYFSSGVDEFEDDDYYAVSYGGRYGSWVETIDGLQILLDRVLNPARGGRWDEAWMSCVPTGGQLDCTFETKEDWRVDLLFSRSTEEVEPVAERWQVRAIGDDEESTTLPRQFELERYGVVVTSILSIDLDFFDDGSFHWFSVSTDSNDVSVSSDHRVFVGQWLEKGPDVRSMEVRMDDELTHLCCELGELGLWQCSMWSEEL